MYYISFQAVKDTTHEKTVFIFTSASEKIDPHVITTVHFRSDCGDAKEETM
jgi:hypothetical protein